MPGEDYCTDCKNKLLADTCPCICHVPIFDASIQEKLGKHEIITREQIEEASKTNKQELIDKLFTKLPKEAWVSHGFANHSIGNRYDCLDCIETEMFFLKAIKSAGGLTKFVNKEKTKLGL